MKKNVLLPIGGKFIIIIIIILIASATSSIFNENIILKLLKWVENQVWGKLKWVWSEFFFSIFLSTNRFSFILFKTGTKSFFLHLFGSFSWKWIFHDFFFQISHLHLKSNSSKPGHFRALTRFSTLAEKKKFEKKIVDKKNRKKDKTHFTLSQTRF